MFLYSQWGLSLAPARSSSLAMGTLLVMIAISRGRRPSLFGVLRSSSSRLYWDRSSCTKSNSWCSTASNNASLLWNCDTKRVYMKLKKVVIPWTFHLVLVNAEHCTHVQLAAYNHVHIKNVSPNKCSILLYNS